MNKNKNTYKKKFNQYKNENLDEIIKILKENNSFYYEDKMNIKIIEKLEKVAKSFGREVTRTSVRNIYNAFKDIEMQLNQRYISKLNINAFGETESVCELETKMNKEKEEVFAEIKPIIKLMKGKIHYLISRKIEGLNKNNETGKSAYKHIEIFFEESLNVIDEAKEFEAFLKVFECIYGYLRKGSEN